MLEIQAFSWYCFTVMAQFKVIFFIERTTLWQEFSIHHAISNLWNTDQIFDRTSCSFFSIMASLGGYWYSKQFLSDDYAVILFVKVFQLRKKLINTFNVQYILKNCMVWANLNGDILGNFSSLFIAIKFSSLLNFMGCSRWVFWLISFQTSVKNLKHL